MFADQSDGRNLSRSGCATCSVHNLEVVLTEVAICLPAAFAGPTDLD